MNETTRGQVSGERETRAWNGWLMLLVNLVVLIGAVVGLVRVIVHAAGDERPELLWWLIPAILLLVTAVILLGGHFTLQPNEARVLILFGAYKGTVRQQRFLVGKPVLRAESGANSGATGQRAARRPQGGPAATGILPTAATARLSAKISLRARNFNSEKLKVNDKRGNPVEIAAVVVWRVEDTAKAAFDVDDYESYVHIQSEAAIRHLASLYAYDRGEEHEPTLRESADEVARGLAEGIAGAAGQGGRGRRGSAADAPGVRAGDRPRRCCAASRRRR